MRVTRRRLLAAGLLAWPGLVRAVAAGEDPPYPVVRPGLALAFPRDFGSHPAFRTEWWYVTGWLQAPRGPLGFQITFFRHRPRIGENSGSRFAPRQLLFAHAALADPSVGHLQHAERVARAGFGLAEASEATTDVHVGDWSLRRERGAYVARIIGNAFTFDLQFAATQPPLLQGDNGYSRKGPRPEEASYYVSEPQLAVSGRVVIGAREFAVQGNAWCDHEWSSEYLAENAAGWDWTGIDLAAGGALMAFRIRRREGGVLWAGGALRSPAGDTRILGPQEVRFTPQRVWSSPRTQVGYPVAMRLEVGDLRFDLTPLFDDQELDARASTGTIYWEGAVRAMRDTQELGRGYLELTGYAGPLRL